MPTGAQQILPLINSYITSAVDNVVAYLESYYQSKAPGGFQIPTAPDINSPLYQQWLADFGPGGMYDLQNAEAAQIVQTIQNLLNSASAAPSAP